MNCKLSQKLNAFPKNHELSEAAHKKISAALIEENKRLYHEAKPIKKIDFNKPAVLPLFAAAFLGIALLLFIAPEREQYLNGHPRMNSYEETDASPADYAAIQELATIWANALKSRDGKPRYDMMAPSAQQQFKQEQIERSGENWNYVIGDSSPWVAGFKIEVDQANAVILYSTQTSEPAHYETKEQVTFGKKDGKWQVLRYKTIYENKHIEGR